MGASHWFVSASLLAMGIGVACAGEGPDYRTTAAAECPQDAVDTHVLEQFETYGPRSKDREYFGFIYLFKSEFRSAVVHGSSCPGPYTCAVNSAKAAPQIPAGAKVLGEWHTHPHSSKARQLSADDVRGAQNNRHIRCYAAYYSQPDGDVYAWDPFKTSVPTAMNSRVLIGNYRRAVRDSALVAETPPPENPPGEQDEAETELAVRSPDLR